MLSAEISTIYRGGDRTRKVHHLIYAPTLEAAARITEALSKIGNLASDGRPIIGLDSRDLLEITLAGGPGCYLVPAHAWTPWFAVLGSKSGFDRVADCYRDLADHVFAIETGLSSDPSLNWMCSSLDGYRLVSNSDAHSPPMLGREATTLSCDLDYFAMAEAFRSGSGLAGTIEFFPEEGKYHLDGHRKCGVRLEPDESDRYGGICPACGKPLTIGVLHRVAELADRPAGYRPPGAPGFTRLVQLRQVVGEIVATGPASKKVAAEVSRLVGALGPELGILREAPLADVQRAGGGALAEALDRLRQGAVLREAGYDGEYGTVRLFAPGELGSGAALFDLPARELPARDVPGRDAPDRGTPAPRLPADDLPATDRAAGDFPASGLPARDLTAASPPAVDLPALGSSRAAGPPRAGAGLGELLRQLDAEQRTAALADSPLMIVAGPGTGKTRTLIYRIACQLTAGGLPGGGRAPGGCLAVTFTRRAADELRMRLAALLPPRDLPTRDLPTRDLPLPAAGLAAVTVTTFHGLGMKILRERHADAGLPADFEVADEAARQELAAELAGSARAGRDLLRAASTDAAARMALVQELAARGLVDFDGLVEQAAALLRARPELAAAFRERWPLISVDEYQDIDAVQYELLTLLAGNGAGLTAIGDPDQSIYGFRGADVGFFLRFSADYPGATTCRLSMNYRSGRPIVAAAAAAIAPGTLVPGRTLRAAVTGAPVIAHEAADEHAEAAWVGATIDQLLGGASFHSIDSGRAGSDGHAGLSLADIAVLYRTDAQAGILGQALIRSGLPFRKGSHDLLQRRTGVPEILAQMRLAASSAGGAPPPGTGPGSARLVADQLAAAVRTLAGQLPAPQAVDIRAAGELLTPLACRCAADPEQFAAEVALGAVVDALDPRADAITLLTLHAAKGLEFEVVFVTGCEKGLLPLRPMAPQGGGPPLADVAEERRLLFVGMTRARSRLLISYAASRTRYGAATDAGASPFLCSISPALPDVPAPPRPRRAAERQLRLL
ncbi:MAG TPA: UvrD-helicase domain-containing protein [Streptosporangiaceae bacterium]